MTARVKAFLPRHKLSWAVGVLLLAAMVLIVVPGVHQPQVSYGFDPQANPPLLTTDSSATAVYYDYTHGWPYAFARRWVGYDLSFLATRTNRASLTYPGGREISWSIPDAWPWQSDRLELSWPALVADLLIAMAIIGGGVGATELWLRRRGRLRFRIVDVVVVVSLGSLFLGWRQWHINTQRAEFELVSSLFGVQEAPPSRFGLHPLVDMRKLTPVGHDSMRWFTRLVGTSRLLEWRFHRESLCITDYAIERYSTKDLKSLHGLRYLDSLFLFYSPTATLLEKTTIPDTVRNLAIVNNDRHIRRIVENPRKLADETIDLSTLAQLPNLENLRVSCPLVLMEDLEPLLACESLEVVAIDISATQADVDRFIQEHRPRFELRRSASYDYYSTPREVDEEVLRKVRAAREQSGGKIGRPDLVELPK